MAGAGTLAACAGNGGKPAPSASAAGVVLSAESASAFVDSIGVDVHMGYRNTSYRNTSAVLDRLVDLGVHHVRDSLAVQPNDVLLNALKEMPARQLSAVLALGQSNSTTLPKPAAVLGSLHLVDRRAVDAVEVPNEWDHQGGRNWLSQIVTFTRSFGRLLRADPVWGDAGGDPVLFVGPSTGGIRHVQDLPNLAATVDVANLHVYTSGGPPEGYAHYLDDARRAAPGKPLWVTEFGFHTAVNQDGKQPAVTEAQQGSYLARQLLGNFNDGVARSYIYELLDDRPETGLKNQERHFGLLRPDLSPKPSYTLLKNLITSVRDPAGDTTTEKAGSAPAFTVRLQTPGDKVGSLLLHRNDGTYRLVLWAEGGLHLDGTAKATDARISLQLSGQPRDVSISRTSGGAITGDTKANVTQITGKLGGDPVIVDIESKGVADSANQQANGRKISFDATGLAPGAASVAHGNVGKLPSRVKIILICGLAFFILALAVTMSTWARRNRRTGRQPK